MTTTIKVWSDYVCPYCLLAEEPLRKAIEGLDVEIEWMPFELRPHPVPTLYPEGEYLQTVWARSVYPMARRMDVPIRLPDISPQPYTRLAFEGYQFAAAHGKGTEYTPRLLRAFFQENLDIGDIEVLVRLAGELGLPVEEFRTALEEGTYTEAHQKALRLAEANDIHSVPTLIIGGTQRIEGVVDPERIRRAIAAAESESRIESGTACGIDGC
ncbi:DsbA family oxidoreductase [Kitasatospora sp. GP82]|uniref:DsbA family oxidoreductase n=1 Tax=Kitasatospora sp. GP82 TaxID=3035089 RepID=UPI00247601A5|nr:DsbA family oxidoreductase [Kitasatospora sp. GP82]MDH6128160.1 putative DsbA family dithiol-disulfide isomerase [Kitasatospora sp. GP82]